MAKATSARQSASRRSRPSKQVAWQPPRPRFSWGLADGLGLTALVGLVFAWPGQADASAVSALILTVGALACIPFGLSRWLAAPRRASLSWIPLGAAAFLPLWALVSTIGSGAPWQVSVYGWLGRSDGLLFLVAVAALLVSAAALRGDEIQRMVSWLLVAGAVLVVEAFGQLAGATYPPVSAYGAISAALGNPNFLAATAAALAVLAVGRSLRSSGSPWTRAAVFALAVGLAVVATLTQSVQGPVALAIGLLAGAVAWSLQYRGKGRPIALTLSGLVVLSGLVGLVLTVGRVGPFAAIRGAETIGYREAYWEAAWRTMSGLPVFGTGPDGFARYVAEFRTETYLAAPGSQIRVSAAHDIPLQFGATLGVLGMAGWLVLMLSTAVLLVRGLLRGTQQIWLTASVAGAWIAYLAQAVISIDAPGLKALGWLLTGLVIAIASSPVADSVPGRPRPGVIAISGALGLLALIAWLPSVTATSAAITEEDAAGAIGNVTNPMVPCPLRQQTLSSLTEVVPLTDLVEVARAALDVDPRCAAMAQLTSEIALRAGDLEGARNAADIAVETDPLAPGSWFGLSLVLEAQGDQVGADQALAEAKRLAAIDPSDNLDQALATDPAAQPTST